MVKKKIDIGIIDAIKEAVSLVIEEKGLVTREDLKYLPNKDEFYSKIEKLQKIHPHNTHPAFA